MPDKIHNILKQYWGYETFRPLQEDIINSVLEGKDTLALLPTGGGKSVCFQVPALAMEGLCLVITPLIALMSDQVEHLHKRGIKAYEIHSGMHSREIDFTMQKCMEAESRFLYISPERLQSKNFLASLRHMNISLLAVDEAHCISEWGYDFRPPYLQISNIWSHIKRVPVIALTATAIPAVVDDIQQKLEFRKENVFKKSFFRDNLAYVVQNEEDKYGKILRVCSGVGGTGIIYVRNRRLTAEIASILNKNGIKACNYHAGMELKQRSKTQQDWMESRVQVMVATNAFGMGIDKPDVRFVIHYDLSDSIEAYFQEAGRAGRDGKKSFAVQLFNNSDLLNMTHLFNQVWPEPELIRQVYNALGNYLQVPVGSGKDSMFEFSVEDFAGNYKMNPFVVFNSMKILEREGYIALDDGFEQASRLLFLCDKEQLHHFQVNNLKYDLLIKTLLRSYSGLFTDYSHIYEYEIARRMKIAEEEVRKMLEFLSTQQIADYIHISSKPHVIFVCDRQQPVDVLVSSEKYFKRKKEAERKINAVVEYVTSNDCRNVALLKYFGEKNAKVCGICDRCIEKRKSQLKENEIVEIRMKIIELLKNAPMSIRDITKKLNLDEKKLILLIRILVDDGILHQHDEMISV